MERTFKLNSGSSVGIVGGGPAGSLFALYLNKFAHERGFRPRVTIYEPRNFAEGGPKACNRSAGILSASFIAGLREIPVDMPESVVQGRLNNYRLHSPYGTVSIANPVPGSVPLVVFRGGGPLHGHSQKIESFDGYLLELARQAGLEVVRQRVAEVRLGPRPAVVYGDKAAEHDLVVLACGVNSASPEVSGSAYGEPETCLMAQDELFAVQEVIQSRMGDTVDIFFLPGSRLVFGSLVPKGSFVNVSLLAAGCEPPSVEEFLGNEMVKKALDFDYVRCCGCRGRAGVRAALNPFDNGFVAIGDACVSRLYKDGIGSALKTARQAAFTAIARGISRDDFRHGYQPLCRAIDRDNHYGNVLFALHQWVKNHPSFLKAQEKLVTTEQARSVTDRPYSHVIWGMFTGNDDYRHIMTMAMSPGSLGRMVSAMFKAKFGA